MGVDEEPSQLERLCSAARQASQDCSDSASSVSSGGASVSDFIAESWEEGEKASQQDPESPTVRLPGLGMLGLAASIPAR